MADNATAFHTRAASAGDLAAVRRLLEAAKLPADGLEDQFPDGYDVVTRDGTVVAAAGVEVHGRAGLLRSVVVDAALRGQGFGAQLSQRRIQWARQRGLDEVWLLTTTAATFFPRLGFRPADRAGAPVELQRSREFAGACPASAACLKLELVPKPAA